MNLSALELAILVGSAAFVVTVVLVVRVVVKNYIKVPPNRVVVISGRGQSKTVRNGGVFRVPGLQESWEMELEPFSVESTASNVYSKDSVPVTVDAVAVVGFGATDEALNAATRRFLSMNRDAIRRQLADILAGIMRNIASQMTVEELNGDREGLRRKILAEAEEAFGKIGMDMDVFAIQNVTDRNGYIDSLGQGRIAEVKAEATIRAANAKRDADVQSAQADQEARTAQALAATAVAQAERDRDLKLAGIKAEVTAANAEAEANGKRAAAAAQKAVITAQVANDRERVEAEIGVEELRARKAEQTAVADVVKPAEAARQAAILRAEGDKAATIAAAEADAEKRRLAGAAEADARVAAANAEKAEMLAQADGKKAQLLAEADGQRALADALNALSDHAAAQRVLPALIEALPAMAAAIATPLGQIDRMVVIDNNGGSSDGEGGDTLSRVMSAVPLGLAAVIETIKATTGYDLQGLLAQAARSHQVGGALAVDATADEVTSTR